MNGKWVDISAPRQDYPTVNRLKSLSGCRKQPKFAVLPLLDQNNHQSIPQPETQQQGMRTTNPTTQPTKTGSNRPSPTHHRNQNHGKKRREELNFEFAQPILLACKFSVPHPATRPWQSTLPGPRRFCF